MVYMCFVLGMDARTMGVKLYHSEKEKKSSQLSCCTGRSLWGSIFKKYFKGVCALSGSDGQIPRNI